MASRNGITERSRGNAWPTPLRDAVLVTPFRDALRTRRIYVFQEMTISLAVPDILVARAKSGDLEALEALYRAFETPVYNVALRMLRRQADGERSEERGVGVEEG